MKLAPGVEVGPYKIVEQVGRGGMATVFKAYQPALERMVAVKVLPEFLAEDPQFRERFRREAVAIAKLRHPNILAVYDHGEFDGQPYIVTEFVEGGTFAAELGRPIGLLRATEVLEPIASALDYAHRRGVLHRDVKPSNILITKDGSPVLGDFGLARMMATNERLTRLDTVVGTPEYMSPEQCAGTETGPASDQYALGVVAYEALTGHPPYHAETPAAVMLAQIQAPLPPPHTVNAELAGEIESALMRALAKEPADRFPDCTDFVETLTGAKAPAPVVAVPRPMATVPTTAALPEKVVEAARQPASRGLGRRPLVIGAAALVVLLVIGGLAYAAYNGSKKGPGQSTPSNPGLSHGSLIYDAKLSAAAWATDETPTPNPAKSGTLGYGGSSIDLRFIKDDVSFSGEFDAPALKEYVSHLVIKVDPGSDFEITWRIRGPGPGEAAEIDLDMQVAQEAMTLYLSPNVGSNQALAPTLPLAGLQSGRTIDFGVVVKGTTVSLFVDGVRVAQATDSRSTGATTPGFYMDGKSGALHILAVRYYALP
jgi:serine/threonine protein kinase